MGGSQDLSYPNIFNGKRAGRACSAGFDSRHMTCMSTAISGFVAVQSDGRIQDKTELYISRRGIHSLSLFHHLAEILPPSVKIRQWRPFTPPEPILYRKPLGITNESRVRIVLLGTDAAGHAHPVETTTPAAKPQENGIPTDTETEIALQTAIGTLGMTVDGGLRGLLMIEAASVGPVHLTMRTAPLLPTCTAPVVVREMVQEEEIEAIGAAGPQVLVGETGSSSKLVVRRQQFVTLTTDTPLQPSPTAGSEHSKHLASISQSTYS